MSEGQTWRVIHGRVEDVLGVESLGRFDAVLCDPPYGIKFMGSSWDHGVPSAEVWRLVRGHAYPGSHVVAFGGTRTFHRLAVNMEDAGLEMRDSFAWHYAQGWPKPANVGKYVDKVIGATRPVVGRDRNFGKSRGKSRGKSTFGDAAGSLWGRTWDGWHGNLAPAWEPALVFREPCGTYARQALDHGVAGLHVDGNRIGTSKEVPASSSAVSGSVYAKGLGHPPPGSSGFNPNVGRWPANVILCCEEGLCGEDANEHAPGCPIRELDDQSGHLKSGSRRAGTYKTAASGACYGEDSRGPMPAIKGDSGGASRFFYHAKVSRRERGESAHPCMKPIGLCRHLAGLLLQPPFRRRRLLVPYSGSGSEMIGGLLAGWDEVVGIEADEDGRGWVDLARERIPAELAYWRERDAKRRTRRPK